MRARYKLRKARCNHLQTRHTKAERKQVPRLGNVTQIAVPTHDLPEANRLWSCHVCNKGLPHMPQHWFRESVKKHFAQEHPETTPTDAYRKRQHNDDALRKKMANRGHHVGQCKVRKQQEDLEQWGPETGHDLHYLTFTDPPPEGFRRNCHSLSWLVCRTGRRCMYPCQFKENPCVEQQLPVTLTLSRNLRKYCHYSTKNYEAAVQALSLSPREAGEVLGPQPTQELGQRPAQTQEHDSHVGQRIGEASHPGPRVRRHQLSHLEVWTINTGGAKGAWKLLPLLSGTNRPDIIFLQETAFQDSEWRSYQNETLRQGFHAFYSGTVNDQASKKLSGGATVMVRRTIPVRPAWSLNHQGGAAQGVWIRGILFTSLYLAPNPESLEVFYQTCHFLENLPKTTKFLIGGDLNATPEECPFQHVIHPLNICASDQPTRWQGNRIIDYFVTTEFLDQPRVPALVISDHKIQAVTFPCAVETQRAFAMAPSPRLPTPKVSKVLWQQKVQQQWDQHKQALPPVWSADVDHDWRLLAATFYDTIIDTFRHVEPNALDSIPKALLRRGKPFQVRVVQKDVLKRPTAGAMATFQERCLHNLLARLREAARHELVDSPLVAQRRDKQKLWNRIQRSPHYDHALGIQRNIRRISTQLQNQIDAADAARLSRWQERMPIDKKAFRWLRQEQQPVNHAIRTDSQSPAGRTVQESLSHLQNFWSRIWNRQLINHDAFWQDYIAQTPRIPAPDAWARLTVFQVKAAHQNTLGTAAGADAWAAEELTAMCDDMWLCLIDFYHHCEDLGQIPTVWLTMRQVHIPKQKDPQVDGSTLADHLRPISIASIWWRILQSARFREPHTQQWLQRGIPSWVYGGVPGKGAEDAIAPLLVKESQKWILASLDLTKAFDFADPTLAIRVLRHQEWPPARHDSFNLPGRTKLDIFNLPERHFLVLVMFVPPFLKEMFSACSA